MYTRLTKVANLACVKKIITSSFSVFQALENNVILSFEGRTETLPLEGTERKNRQLHVRPLLPVMVWFHGGGYVRGSSSQFGPQFMMREDIVLVTVNYRLGVLGNY